jgi:ribosomal protein S17
MSNLVEVGLLLGKDGDDVKLKTCFSIAASKSFRLARIES